MKHHRPYDRLVNDDLVFAALAGPAAVERSHLEFDPDLVLASPWAIWGA